MTERSSSQKDHSVYSSLPWAKNLLRGSMLAPGSSLHGKFPQDGDPLVHVPSKEDKSHGQAVFPRRRLVAQ